MMVNVDGIRFHLEVSGEGFPLVLLHGFTGDSSTWASFFDKWGSHSRLIVPDIIGHGRTESPEDLKHYQIESMAHSLYKILEITGVHQIDLLGYSMGGRLALTFAVMFPNRVRKLILESSSPGLETASEREVRRMNDAKLAKFIVEEGLESFINYWEDISLFKTMKRLPVSVQSKVREQRLRNSTRGLANSLLGMGTGSQPSWWRELSGLKCEVLLLTGEKDLKFGRIAESMTARIKNAKWMVVQNSGHAIHVEESEKFGTIVSDFLSNKL